MERWSEVDTLFEAALDRPREERIVWLHDACEDPELQAEVERLLKAHERTGGVLDAPLPIEAGDFDSLDEGVGERRVGPYRLLREIGRGGMSVVYLAEREAPYRQRVAVKLLRPGLATGDLVRRFLAERQILASLDHPNIARLLDGGVSEDGRPYFVMEVVEGQSITRYCDAHRLSIEQRLALFQRVCEAVQYAHRNLVVHRDLKPSNILVTDESTDGEPSVKLLDFGIAKLLDPEAVPVAAPRTRTGLRPMTPEYAAPEQVRGGPITTATDVYGLGVVLSELLTGRRPYRVAGRMPSEIERAICEQEPPLPSAIVAQSEEEGGAPEEAGHARSTTLDGLQRTLRGDLDTIVRKALHKDPERRYDSAERLAADLERYRSGLPVRARPDTLGYRLRKFTWRHRWSVAAAVAFVLLLAGYAATVTLQAQQIAEERDRARVEAIKTAHVKDFLIDLFGSVSPEGVQDGAAAMEEVLAGGAERVRRDLADQPEVRAEMLSALGDVYERLGRYAAARPLFEEALAACRAYFEEPNLAVANALGELAALERKAGRPARAEALYREALALLRDLRGEDHIAVAQARHDLAALLEAEGEAEAAGVLYAKALPVYRRVLGGAHGQTATLMTSLAALKCGAGDREAVVLYEEALTLERERLGMPSEHVAAIRAELEACRNTLRR